MSKNSIQFQKGLSLASFLEKYGTQEQCFEALVKLRWPDGFECTKCGCRSHCRLKRNKLFQCYGCQSQNSITSGTLFHSTKVPLPKWFLALYLMTQGKNGISQLELDRQLGVTINTAAKLYHKIAQTMLERDSSKLLSGDIEIDDAYGEAKRKVREAEAQQTKHLLLLLWKKQPMVSRSVSNYR